MNTHGILLLDKPAGITSNALLGRARHLLGIRKAGHTGTLDPFATGLLVVCFGEATKICAYLLDDDKGYEAEVTLGSTTSTGDPEGVFITRADVPSFTADEIVQTLQQFKGEIEQIPPMHSALKHEGKRLYELARAGKTVARKPRRITIHHIELLALALPRFTLRVSCSKGTYIRTLGMDIGEHLECGAHLSALRRTSSGPFELTQAITLEQLEVLTQQQRRARLLPITNALPDWPAVTLDTQQNQQFRHGQPVADADGALPTPDPGQPGDAAERRPVLVFHAGQLSGIGELDSGAILKPRRLFHQ